MAKKKKSKEEIDFDKNFSDEEKIQIENELLKLKIETELGTELQQLSEMDVPPMVENLFLNQIYDFHQQLAHSKKVKIYEYIGSPDFIAPEDILTKKEFSRELKRLVRYMKKHGVELEIEGKQTHEELYRFLVKELFEYMIDDVKVKGSKYIFHYEDFHPDYAELMEHFSEEFIETVFGDLAFHPLLKNMMKDEVWLNGKAMSKEGMIKYLEEIKEFFPRLQHLGHNEQTLQKDSIAFVKEVTVQFKDRASEKVVFYFEKVEKQWLLDRIDMKFLNVG